MKAALYARYSTDRQSESSIEDQYRVCQHLSIKHQFEVTARFHDAAISGGTAHRAGYQAMLAAARKHEFDVIVAEDASRLWRNSAEQAQRLAELRDLGIHVVTHDLDTRQESAVLMGAITGAMAEHYRQEIGRRTRRGLEGLARQAKPTGGRAYGYRMCEGRRQIDPKQAEIVREIFERYAAGWSAIRIAADLNSRGVPSPGSTWNRTRGRRRGWMASAINGNPEEGIGILNNDLYRGDIVWNRCRWIRSAVDGKKRRRVLNPHSQWVVHHDESLRVVPEDLWLAVRRRQCDRSALIGERVRRGLSKSSAKSVGRQPRYLFSGLLKCGCCGSNYVIAGAKHYACASYVNGKACTNSVRVRRDAVEEALLAGIRDEMLSAESVREACRRVRLNLRQKATSAVPIERIRKAEAEVANLTEALATGALRASPALAARFEAAERQLSELRARESRASTPAPSALLPDIASRYRRLARDLARSLQKADVDRARIELGRVLGPVRVEPSETEIRLYNEQGRLDAALLRAVGSDTTASFCGSGGRI